MDFNMTNASKNLEDPDSDRSKDVVNAIYTLVIFFIIFLFEIGGNKWVQGGILGFGINKYLPKDFLVKMTRY